MSYQSRFYSPAKFDSDQKDVLISQLKAEIFELRQNERDFGELSSHLKNLEHRYTILSDEKLRSENDLRQRNEQNMKTIANLRADIDTLKSSVTEKHIESQELRAENLAIKEIADHRALDISRLKTELSHLNELNSRGNSERISLEGEIQQLRDEKRKNLEELDIQASKIDTLQAKSSEQEKLIREFEFDKQSLEKQISQQKHNIENIEFELRQKNDSNKLQQQQLNENVQQIGKLQDDIEQLENLVEKYRQESTQYQKQLNQETNKSFELGTQILNLETALKSRESQTEDQKKEIDQLKQQSNDQQEQIEQLLYDNGTFKKQIEHLSQQNTTLMNELEIFADQDEQVRQILNRKSRVKELKLQSDSTLRHSYNSMIRSSPSKKNSRQY